MSGNHTRQSDQIQYTYDRISLLQQAVAERDQKIAQLEAPLVAMNHRQMMGWLFSPRIDETRRQAIEVDNLRSENSQLRQQLDQQHVSLLSHMIASEQASQHVNELEKKYADLEQSHREYVDKHGSKFRHEIMALREQVSDLETAKALEKTIADDRKVSDNAILEIWKRMAYNICVIASTLLTHCPTREELAASCHIYTRRTSQITPVEYKLLEDKNTRSAVVENHIWRSVVSHIFGAGEKREQSGAWGGIAGIRFFFLCSNLIRKFVTVDKRLIGYHS